MILLAVGVWTYLALGLVFAWWLYLSPRWAERTAELHWPDRRILAIAVALWPVPLVIGLMTRREDLG